MMQYPLPQDMRPLKTPRPGPFSEGLELYLPLDSHALRGGQALDLSGNERHAEVAGADPVPGALGEALGFNGSSDYLDTGYMFTVGAAEEWTFLLRVKAAPGASGVFMGVGRAWNGYWNRLQLNFNTGARVYVRDDSYALIANFTGSLNIVDGAWHAVALIVSPLNDEVLLYVDGKQDGSASASFSSLTTGTNKLNYGCLYNNGNRSDYAGCMLDEPRIHSRRLTPGDIRDYSIGLVRT